MFNCLLVILFEIETESRDEEEEEEKNEFISPSMTFSLLIIVVAEIIGLKLQKHIVLNFASTISDCADYELVFLD